VFGSQKVVCAGLAVVVESVRVSALVATWGVPEESDDDKIISPEAFLKCYLSTSFVVVGQHVWPWELTCVMRRHGSRPRGHVGHLTKTAISKVRRTDSIGC
jgi:hypothetical protein